MEYGFEEVQLTAGSGIAIRETHSIAELPAFFAGAFTELDTVAKAAGAQLAGPPFARYFSVASDAVDLQAVFPLAAPVADVQNRVDAAPTTLPMLRTIRLWPSARSALLRQAPEPCDRPCGRRFFVLLTRKAKKLVVQVCRSSGSLFSPLSARSDTMPGPDWCSNSSKASGARSNTLSTCVTRARDRPSRRARPARDSPRSSIMRFHSLATPIGLARRSGAFSTGSACRGSSSHEK
jgi:hypothetical protein